VVRVQLPRDERYGEPRDERYGERYRGGGAWSWAAKLGEPWYRVSGIGSASEVRGLAAHDPSLAAHDPRGIKGYRQGACWDGGVCTDYTCHAVSMCRWCNRMWAWCHGRLGDMNDEHTWGRGWEGQEVETRGTCALHRESKPCPSRVL